MSKCIWSVNVAVALMEDVYTGVDVHNQALHYEVSARYDPGGSESLEI